MFGFGRLALLAQPVIDQPSNRCINDSEQRYTDNPSSNAPEAAEEHNGKDYPEVRKACGIAQNLRS